ncbi:MAG: hypothetical protein QOG21_1119 [Actinomycetota bacterium]|jgi:hypothetical protein|nr:hypothetical protein [Actinomycetota bacterium]
MFAQVIKGKVKDEAGLRKQFDRWVEEVKPGAVGFLGATTGASKDGTWFTVARFESEDAARRSSDRPEQGTWWSETEQYLSDVSFKDCSEVDAILDGGSNDAGFVQVMEGRATDVEKLRSVGREMEPEMKKMRPDIIGGIVAWHGDGGGYTQIMYFESEASAREAESNTSNEGPPPEFAELMGDINFIDLSDPWFA